MNILCDTNIILDVLLARAPFAGSSADVLRLCESRQIKGYTTASCITDIFYFVRKNLHDTELAYQAIEHILDILSVCDVTYAHIQKALHNRTPDFEDGLVAVCAESLHCNFIITRDASGFTSSRVPALTPQSFLKKLSQ